MSAKINVVAVIIIAACSPRPANDTAPPDPRPALDAGIAGEPAKPLVLVPRPADPSGPPAPRAPSGQGEPLGIAQSPEPCACENSVGVPIQDTHCGYLICGTDRQVYRCGRHVGGTPWTLVQPIRQCAAPGRIQPAQAIQLGGDCANGQACPAPSTCVSYLGIAGARGPTFKTCEIKCSKGAACPTGMKCIRIADGPGEVCR